MYKIEHDDLQRRRAQYLKAMVELAHSHGFFIHGCGCCGSPSVDTVESFDEGPGNSFFEKIVICKSDGSFVHLLTEKEFWDMCSWAYDSEDYKSHIFIHASGGEFTPLAAREIHQEIMSKVEIEDE